MAHTHFTLQDRQIIEQMLERKASQADIACAIGKSRSALSRELKRNIGESEIYKAEAAHQKARKRKSEAAFYSNLMRAPITFSKQSLRKPYQFHGQERKNPDLISLYFPPEKAIPYLQTDCRLMRKRTAPLLSFVFQVMKRLRSPFRDYLHEAIYDTRTELDKKNYVFSPRPEWKLFRIRNTVRNYGPRKDLQFKSNDPGLMKGLEKLIELQRFQRAYREAQEKKCADFPSKLGEAYREMNRYKYKACSSEAEETERKTESPVSSVTVLLNAKEYVLNLDLPIYKKRLIL
jgi:hypothetical protein